MKLSICWEQESWDIVTKESSSGKAWTTPLSILKDIGQEGRSAFIEILVINYRDQLAKEFEEIKKFEERF